MLPRCCGPKPPPKPRHRGLSFSLAAADIRNHVLIADLEIDPASAVIHRDHRPGPDDTDLLHDQDPFQRGGGLADQIGVCPHTAGIGQRRGGGRGLRAGAGGKEQDKDKMAHNPSFPAISGFGKCVVEIRAGFADQRPIAARRV